MSIPLAPTASVTGEDLCLVIVAYLLGCCSAGYYLAKWRFGVDLRFAGSGAVGARNAGRLLGAPSFLIVLLADAAKGALAVFVATHRELTPEVVVAVMAAVVAGHNWPVQLRFQGGKGIATSLGAILGFDPWCGVILALLFAVLWAMMRSFTLSGLAAFATLPLAVFVCGLGNVEVAATSVIALLVLIAHWKNLRDEMTGILQSRSCKEALRAKAIDACSPARGANHKERS